MKKILFILCVNCVIACAAPVDLWFQQANAFYEQQAYDSAASYYEKISESGLRSSDLYYNLGSAYYRLSKPGLAILYFEKALKLSPTDPDIQSNLKFANLNIVDRPPVTERTFLESILFRIHVLFSLNAQLWILFAICAVLSGLFCAGLFASRNIRLWLIYVGSLILLLGVTVGISAGMKIFQEERHPSAVVLTPVADAKNQPDGKQILFTVHEGTKFLIRKQAGSWSLVSLPNGMSGWIENKVLGII
jgi:tetratricopeptide (TPR) repeat protein